jgi:hypothetical protein
MYIEKHVGIKKPPLKNRGDTKIIFFFIRLVGLMMHIPVDYPIGP